MSNPVLAIQHVLHNEGGLVDDPDDPGGATNFGVSLRYLKKLGDSNNDGLLDGDVDRDGDLDVDDIRQLKKCEATRIYKQQWWDRYNYGTIENQIIATKVLDLAVNMGPRQAHRCVQRALRAMCYYLTEDGIIGPRTFSAINDARADALLAALRSEAAGIYRQIAATRPASAKFLNGWLNRAYQ